MTKLTDVTDSQKVVILPDDVRFSNEFKTPTVRQVSRTTIGGKFVYQRGQTLNGRSIKLVGTDEIAWIQRKDIILLRDMYNNASGKYHLLHNGETYTVIFDYEQGSPLVVEPIIPCSNPDDDAWYTFEINLITVDV